MTSARADTRILHTETSAFVTLASRYLTAITSTLNADDGSSTTIITSTSGQYFLCGGSAPFNKLTIEITTNGVGTWSATWQYWNGSTWVALSGVDDPTSAFTAGTGTYHITWTTPSDWAERTFLSVDGYFVRAAMAITSVTTLPQADYAKTVIVDDESQRDTLLTFEGSGGYEDPSARTALDGTGRGRSIELSIEIDGAGGNAALIEHGADQATRAYRITYSGGDISFDNGATTIADITAPNVDGTAKTYIVGWSTEPNPATTGSSDALRSECWVYDVDGDAMAWTVVEHAVAAASDAGAFSVGGQWDGSTWSLEYGGTINAARVSARFHSRVEGREHFVAQTSAPSNDGISAVEVPVLPGDMTEPGAIVGPQYQAVAAAMAVGANRHRLLGPVVQMLVHSPPTYTVDLADIVGIPWVRTLSDGYQMHLGWLWRRKIPRHAGWLRAVVQWATWNTEDESVDVGLRIYAAAAPPHLATEWSSRTITRTTDDGSSSGTGALEAFDHLKIERDADGYTWLWLGYEITEDTADATKMQLRGLTITPMVIAAAAAEQPNQWGP